MPPVPSHVSHPLRDERHMRLKQLQDMTWLHVTVNDRYYCLNEYACNGRHVRYYYFYNRLNRLEREFH